MASIIVTPTRMELTKFKKKLMTAIKGHKLLKDKHDELVRRYIDLNKENEGLRNEVENKIRLSNKHMATAESISQKEIISTALMIPKQEIKLEIEEINVMSVIIPKYKTEYKTSDSSDIFSYGYAFTPIDMDNAVSVLSDILPKMIKLAETEKSCQLLHYEIKKTRRRVNALEHVIIPEYKKNIRYIRMKLDENERGTITRLMKVKDMMLRK